MDKRVDAFELRIAENYLTKSEFSGALERVEQHMVRIENKLDRLANCDKKYDHPIKPILLAFFKSDAVKKLLVDILEKLAKETDNDLDDTAVAAVRVALKV